MAEDKDKKIKYDKNNYRIHSAENKALIKKSLEDCGTGRSILIDNENEIIAGNGVYEQAQKLGLPVKIVETNGKELIAIKRTDLKTEDSKRKQLAVMDNTTSDSSEFDIEKLEADFSTGELSDFGIESIEDQIDGEDGAETENDKKKSSSSSSSSSGLRDVDDIPDDDFGSDYEGADEMQRVIICYKKSDKEKLGELLGVELTKILYSVNDLLKGREAEGEGE